MAGSHLFSHVSMSAILARIEWVVIALVVLCGAGYGVYRYGKDKGEANTTAVVHTALDSVTMAALQHKLDSLLKVTKTDTVRRDSIQQVVKRYTDTLLKHDTLFQKDTTAQQAVAASTAAINACTITFNDCQAAQAQLRLQVVTMTDERDNWETQAGLASRPFIQIKTTPFAIGSGVGGVIGGILLKKYVFKHL